jgi:hypothetical protein
MSIHLSDENRANLERLEERWMKSTRRQKAIALLRLAEGLTTRQAAMHAGISKEEVEALAVEFAESGLAGIGLVGKSKTLVQLVRPGVGAQRYHLENGATLGDPAPVQSHDHRQGRLQRRGLGLRIDATARRCDCDSRPATQECRGRRTLACDHPFVPG